MRPIGVAASAVRPSASAAATMVRPSRSRPRAPNALITLREPSAPATADRLKPQFHENEAHAERCRLPSTTPDPSKRLDDYTDDTLTADR